MRLIPFSVFLIKLSIALCLGWAQLPRASAVQPGANTSLVGGTVIDGRSGGAVISNAVVNISDGRIVAIGPAASTQPLTRARIIDTSGQWILPGLIDAHVHFAQSGGLYTRPDVIDLRRVRPYADEMAWIKARLPRTLADYLCSGITAVADLGGPVWTLRLAGLAPEPQERPGVWAAGPLLTNYVPTEMEGPQSGMVRLTSPAMARAAVDDYAAQGASFIKLWMIQTDTIAATMPSFKAAIVQAHARGLRVFAHATELSIAKEAIRSGIDVLVHGISDQPIDQDFMSLVRRGKVITISTLAVDEGYRRVLSGNVQVSAIMRRCGDPEVIRTWYKLPAHLRGRLQGYDPLPGQNLRRMVEAGLPVAAGSDAGNIGTLHGPGLHRELELLVQAGLSPAQAITAATDHAAHVLTPSPERGSLREGNIADIVVVRKNPLLAISNLQDIELVIREGRTVFSGR